MGRVTDFSLFLMVKHPTADLSDLPQALGLRAARIWKVGEPRVTPKGKSLDGLYRDSYCGLYLDHSGSATLPEAIASAIDQLRPNCGVIDTLIAGGGRFLLNVYWHSAFNTGEEFDASLLRALADMNISLGVDIYCDSSVPFV
jgi:hypothetical protein